MSRVYLDWNATTPPHEDVVAAMAEAQRTAWANPSSVHADGRRARAYVEDAREGVARLAGVDPRDVVLTGGGTEANNLALRSAFAPGSGGGGLVTSRMEHPSIVRVAEGLEAEGLARIRWLRATPSGAVDLDDLERALREGGVRLVALQHVNHETGVIQPVGEARALCERHDALLHVDAVQAFGRLAGAAPDTCGGAPVTRSLAAHKIRGPKGIGALVTRRDIRLAPVLRGGAQERGLRPGTLDPIAAAGLAVAARLALTAPSRYTACAEVRARLEEGLRSIDPDAEVNGAEAMRAPHVTNVAFSRWQGPELVAALDLEGVSVSSGSACSAGTMEPSPVITAMFDAERAARSVRFSLGEDTSMEAIDRALTIVRCVVARQRSQGR